jgi:hypothetical protein
VKPIQTTGQQQAASLRGAKPSDSTATYMQARGASPLNSLGTSKPALQPPAGGSTTQPVSAVSDTPMKNPPGRVTATPPTGVNAGSSGNLAKSGRQMGKPTFSIGKQPPGMGAKPPVKPGIKPAMKPPMKPPVATRKPPVSSAPPAPGGIATPRPPQVAPPAAVSPTPQAGAQRANPSPNTSLGRAQQFLNDHSSRQSAVSSQLQNMQQNGGLRAPSGGRPPVRGGQMTTQPAAPPKSGMRVAPAGAAGPAQGGRLQPARYLNK